MGLIDSGGAELVSTGLFGPGTAEGPRANSQAFSSSGCLGLRPVDPYASETSRASSWVSSLVGVLGLAASYPLLFEDLMSKLMGLLIVGVLRPFGLSTPTRQKPHEQAHGLLPWSPSPYPTQNNGRRVGGM